MRYRALSASGDYTFGQSAANFLVNNAAAVAQSVRTRLLLLRGEWFLDTTDGTPYATAVLGKGTKPLYDQAIKARILATDGVVAIVSYNSVVNNRTLMITATISTIYGPITVVTPLSVGTVSS